MYCGRKAQSRIVMSKLRIYGIARTRAFRALWMAEELVLDYKHIPIEIGPAGARKPEYLAINPNGRLPVHGGRLECGRRDQPRDRHGSLGNAASCAMA